MFNNHLKKKTFSNLFKWSIHIYIIISYEKVMRKLDFNLIEPAIHVYILRNKNICAVRAFRMSPQKLRILKQNQRQLTNFKAKCIPCHQYVLLVKIVASMEIRSMHLHQYKRLQKEFSGAYENLKVLCFDKTKNLQQSKTHYVK